jgi:hypothetical protein
MTGMLPAACQIAEVVQALPSDEDHDQRKSSALWPCTTLRPGLIGRRWALALLVCNRPLWQYKALFSRPPALSE